MEKKKRKYSRTDRLILGIGFTILGLFVLSIAIPITNLFAAELLMPYEVFRKNFFAHMNELEITPGKVRLDEAIRLIVCQMSDFLVPYVISIN